MTEEFLADKATSNTAANQADRFNSEQSLRFANWSAPQPVWIPKTQQINNEVKSVQSKNMLQCWAEALRQMTEFKGRTTLYEFWAFQSVSLVIFLFAALIGYFLNETKMVMDIFAVYFLLPAASSGVRRLHDVSMSGWWILPAIVLALVTLICWNLGIRNIILLMFFTLVYVSYLCYLWRQPGDKLYNKYGLATIEAEKYHLNSRAYISFIMTFIYGLWLIYAAYLINF